MTICEENSFSLFAGIEGMGTGFQKAGFRDYNDFDKDSIDTYKKKLSYIVLVTEKIPNLLIGFLIIPML